MDDRLPVDLSEPAAAVGGSDRPLPGTAVNARVDWWATRRGMGLSTLPLMAERARRAFRRVDALGIDRFEGDWDKRPR